MLYVPYWRDFHFYLVHRFMHPWKTGKGALLATVQPSCPGFVLSSSSQQVFLTLGNGCTTTCIISTTSTTPLRNTAHLADFLWMFRSYNTGPLSGLAMHPVEHLLYYTCTLLPLVFTLHPLHFLLNKLHADVSPVAGHDGHEKPGQGMVLGLSTCGTGMVRRHQCHVLLRWRVLLSLLAPCSL
jgi:sterol desaturase/sphingolipid hydroxylase (fatty acid hydroxylase superfamily)